MHPNTLVFSLAALASVVVSTKDKDPGPRCSEDEYYNKMMESKNRKVAVPDCAKWLAGTITDAKEIPKYFKDCSGDNDEERISRVSAACSCVATSSTRTQVSSTLSSTIVVTTSSGPPTHLSSSSYILRYWATQYTSFQPYLYRIFKTCGVYLYTPTQLSVRPSVVFALNFDCVSSPPTHSSTTESHSTTSPLTTGSQLTDIHSISSPSSVVSTTGTLTTNTHNVPGTTQPSSGTMTGSTVTGPLLSGQSTVTITKSSLTSVAPSQASTTSFTTSTIYTESIYTVTSCAPDKSDCPVASTVLVTSTIAVSTTICPVTETPRPGPPNDEPTTTRMTSTLYSTTTYTLTRCPPGAVNCPVGNLPITTSFPISTTILTATNTVPTSEHSNQGGSNTEKQVSPTQTGGSTGNNGKPDQTPTTFTVMTVPTTIHTIINGVSAQILTVVPVTSALAVSNDGTGKEPVFAPTKKPSDPHTSPTDAPLGATGSQPTQASRSGLSSQPMLPANNTSVSGSSSPRPTVVTAGAPDIAGSDGVRMAFFVLALVALL